MKRILKSIFDHRWDNIPHEVAGNFQARIIIYFNQPRMKVTIDHEVHPKDLEVMSFLLWIDQHRAGLDGVGGDFFHLGVDLVKEVITRLVFFIQVFLEFVIGNFIAFFVLAILRQEFLDSIVRKMDITERIADAVFERSCPDVAVLIPIPFHDTIDGGYHHEVPDVKFPPLVQKRLLDIALNYVRF